MSDLQLTTEGRSALRAAIRIALREAGRADECSAVSDLSKANLLSLAASLGIDARAIAAGAEQNAALAASAVPPVLTTDTHPMTEPNTTMPDTHATDLPALAAEAVSEALAGQASPATEGESVAETREDAPAPDAQAVEAAVRDMMRPLGEGDIAAFQRALRETARDALRGPSLVTRTVTRTVVVEREVAAAALAPLAPGAMPYAVQAGDARCGDLFGPAADWEADTRVARWDAHGAAPAVDPHFRWGASLAPMLSCFAERKPVFLWGPAGGGKTSLVQQFAAKTGRPYVRISCTATTEAAELVGMTVMRNGSAEWQDGQLAAAIRRPGTVILVDEPSIARAGALFVLQAVLDSGELHIAETGEVVRVAPGVLFAFADNTPGTGDATGQYEDTGRLNRATLDRFMATVRVDYLSADDEIAVVVSKAKAPKPLAKVLVDFATVTRREVEAGKLTHGLGLRRLLSLASMLRRGAPLDTAWRVTVGETAQAADREALDQLRQTALSDAVIAKAMGKAPTYTGAAQAAAPVSGRTARAAADFA